MSFEHSTTHPETGDEVYKLIHNNKRYIVHISDEVIEDFGIDAAKKAAYIKAQDQAEDAIIKIKTSDINFN